MFPKLPKLQPKSQYFYMPNIATCSCFECKSCNVYGPQSTPAKTDRLKMKNMHKLQCAAKYQNLGGSHHGPKMPQITVLPFNTPCACSAKLQKSHKSHRQKRFVGDKSCILVTFYLLEVLCMYLSTHRG